MLSLGFCNILTKSIAPCLRYFRARGWPVGFAGILEVNECEMRDCTRYDVTALASQKAMLHMLLKFVECTAQSKQNPTLLRAQAGKCRAPIIVTRPVKIL